MIHPAIMRRRENKAPRRKQRSINCALQSAGFQPAFAPMGGELNPHRLKDFVIYCLKSQITRIRTDATLWL